MTPYRHEPHLEPAPRRASRARRTLAAVVDAGIGLLFLAAMALARGEGGYLAYGGVPFLLMFLFYQSMLLLEVGQSIGKRLVRIVVVRAGGWPLDNWTMFVRTWVPLLAGGLPLLIYVMSGHLWSAWWAGIAQVVHAFSLALPRGRTLYDRLADTDVVMGPSVPTPVPHARLLLRSATLIVAIVMASMSTALLLVALVAAVLFFGWTGRRGF